ncbi:hypothetical protein [Ruegeria sp. HKCCD9179]|uniref:hypothetical protein n=1 Tax=Ruegeria sp. HKCCD9179 TaxID=2683016 RepID=UPI00148A0D62|nr:hypothetical protein [Ruegeria sp. HKCCD9179]
MNPRQQVETPRRGRVEACAVCGGQICRGARLYRVQVLRGHPDYAYNPKYPRSTWLSPHVRARLHDPLNRVPVCSVPCQRLGMARAADRVPLATKRSCEVCGGDMRGKNTDARFCSAACRMRAYRARLNPPNAGNG